VFIATLKALANAFSVRDRFGRSQPRVEQPWEPGVFIATLKALAKLSAFVIVLASQTQRWRQPWEPGAFIATLKALANAFSVRDRFGRSQPRVGGNPGNRVCLLQR